MKIITSIDNVMTSFEPGTLRREPHAVTTRPIRKHKFMGSISIGNFCEENHVQVNLTVFWIEIFNDIW